MYTAILQYTFLIFIIDGYIILQHLEDESF